MSPVIVFIDWRLNNIERSAAVFVFRDRVIRINRKFASKRNAMSFLGSSPALCDLRRKLGVGDEAPFDKQLCLRVSLGEIQSPVLLSFPSSGRNLCSAAGRLLRKSAKAIRGKGRPSKMQPWRSGVTGLTQCLESAPQNSKMVARRVCRRCVNLPAEAMALCPH
jgi:hypothetical protein